MGDSKTASIVLTAASTVVVSVGKELSAVWRRNLSILKDGSNGTFDIKINGQPESAMKLETEFTTGSSNSQENNFKRYSKIN